MSVRAALDQLLAEPETDDAENSKCEEIEERLIPKFGWEAVREAVIEVLESDRSQSDYEVAAEVFWGAALDKRDLPVNKVIALLYYRFDQHGTDENNLVWSIASTLKKVDYLSEYEPLKDVEVLRELEKIRSCRGDT